MLVMYVWPMRVCNAILAGLRNVSNWGYCKLYVSENTDAVSMAQETLLVSGVFPTRKISN